MAEDNSNDSVDAVKTTAEVVTQVLKAAGNDPQVKEAAGNLGKTAVTITKAINNVLLPIAAVNYGFEKAKIYFKKKFLQDIAEKVAAIPQDQIVDPKPSIAGPALQGLAFSHDEVNLKEMYLNLLATAMDGRVASNVHPAFVEIIRQMTSDEAYLIRGILQYDKPTAIAEVRQHVSTQSPETIILIRHIMPMINTASGDPMEFPGFDMMVDNWIRLGLVEIDYTHQVAGPGAYDWIQDRPEIKRLSQGDGNLPLVYYRNGIIQRTSMGLEFAKSVGLLDYGEG